MYWQSMIKDMSFASTPSPELCGPIAAQCRTRSISTRCWGRIFSVLLDNIDEYYNVGQYDYSCDSELFYNGLVAVRVGATDWYLPDGGPWPRLYFNSKYMFIDRSGKIVSNACYDEVSNENDRWFGCHGTTEYLLDSNGNEREQANYCYVPSTWAENIVEQAEKDGLRLSYHTPYRLNIHRDEFCKLAWQTIQTVAQTSICLNRHSRSPTAMKT